MSTHETVLARREGIAAGTMAFYFAKPEGFQFKAGQAIDLILDGEDAAMQGARHTFSLINSPSSAELAIATRIRDTAYKQALRSLPVSARVHIEGPFGSLTLHNNRTRPAVLIAGGIGITPFISILRQAAEEKTAHRLVLLYANRRPEEAAFLTELQQLERENRNFRFMPLMTQAHTSAQSWPGARGHIDAVVLKGIADEWPASIWYVAGPPAMVEGMRRSLTEARVDPDDVRTEEFHGY